MKDFKWVYLAHLGYNMWGDPAVYPDTGVHGITRSISETMASPVLLFEEDVWRVIADELRAAGATAIVLDIGEGMRYDTHPELAVEGSWSKEKLAGELARLRSMGFEVFPKLNFSACHDMWLGEWGRMLSTQAYYKTVCDLIDEVAEVFGRPGLFHLGMDEENAELQKGLTYCVIRQGEQWWYDFGIMCKAVERNGCRPWIWSDYVWHHRDEFFANMPREVVQSNWFYGGDFSHEYAKYYDEFARLGYDQIPTGSNWSCHENLEKTAEYIKKLPQDHIMGIMQTPWFPSTKKRLPEHEDAIKALAEARAAYR
ncbi:MAG: hypothetical protein K6D94_09435 [Clostridiales bacterium]|nr:hypothetical protein [Clostridiales bacterium]